MTPSVCICWATSDCVGRTTACGSEEIAQPCARPVATPLPGPVARGRASRRPRSWDDLLLPLQRSFYLHPLKGFVRVEWNVASARRPGEDATATLPLPLSENRFPHFHPLYIIELFISAYLQRIFGSLAMTVFTTFMEIQHPWRRNRLRN